MKILSWLFCLICITQLTACVITPAKVTSYNTDSNINVVKEYIAKGGNPNASSEVLYGSRMVSGQLLHQTVGNNQIKIAEILLEAGANVNADNHNGEKPIVYVNSADMVELLVKYNANVNVRGYEGWTPIFYGCNYGCAPGAVKRKTETIAALLDNGADHTLKSDKGVSAGVSIEKYYKYKLNVECVIDSDTNKCRKYISHHPIIGDEHDFEIALEKLGKDCRIVEPGWFYKGMCNNGIAHGEGFAAKITGDVFFEGKFNEGIFIKGTMYDDVNPVFTGSYKNNAPHDKGTCYHSGKKEKCNYENGKRVDRTFLVRGKQFCRSNPFPISKIHKVSASISNACKSNANSFSNTVNEYKPSRKPDYVVDDYYSLIKCYDNNVEENKAEVKLLSKALKNSLKLADSHNCMDNSNIYYNAGMYENDLSVLNENIENISNMQERADIMINSVHARSEAYDEAQSSKRSSGSSFMKILTLGAVAGLAGSSGVSAEQAAQVITATGKDLYGNSGGNASNLMALNQKAASDLHSQRLNSLNKYRDGSNDSENTKISTRNQKSESYKFTCPNPPGAKPQTVELTAYTESCLTALKTYFKVQACNLIDDMKSSASRCVDACGRPDCMEAAP